MVLKPYSWLIHGNGEGSKLIRTIADKVDGMLQSNVSKTKDSLMNLYKKSWKNVKQEPEPAEDGPDAKPKSKYAKKIQERKRAEDRVDGEGEGGEGA